MQANVEFQFTHPGKGATDKNGNGIIDPWVSIHAPWEGCDSWQRSMSSPLLLFQFTHPGKGATSALCITSLDITCFNSRTLGRVRLVP